MLDRFDCYELCVQSPRHVAGFLRGLVRGPHPTPHPILAEDFCGTAAVSRRWVADARGLAGGGAGGLAGGDGPLAIAADLDAQTLDKARTLAARDGVADGIAFAHTDVLTGALPPAHVIFVGNFSIGYLHDRASLVAYLARCRARLARSGGAFVCDTYGGPGAFRLGALQRKHPAPGREIIHYLWRHEDADPVTALVTNSISFRIELDGEIIADLPRAFVYRWRLWSLPELREAMLDAGFQRMEVYRDVDGPPTPTPTPASTDDLSADGSGDWIVLAVGRTED